MRHTTPLLVALCALAPAVVAQDTLKIDPGERVRLTLESGRSTVGVLVTQDRDSLRIRPRPDAPPAAFSRSRIAGVEASLGRHGHAGTGLLFGALVGVFVRSERWEQVYENPVQVGFAPPGRGLGVRVSIRL